MNKKKKDKQGRQQFKVSIFCFNIPLLREMLCVWAQKGSNWG